jgi:hypothetical protein
MYIDSFFLAVGNFSTSCEVLYKHICTQNGQYNEHVQMYFIVMHIDTIELFFGKFRVKMFWKGEAKLLYRLLLQIRIRTGSIWRVVVCFVWFGLVCLHSHGDIGCSLLGLSTYCKEHTRIRQLSTLYRDTGLSGHLNTMYRGCGILGNIILYEMNTKWGVHYLV